MPDIPSTKQVQLEQFENLREAVAKFRPKLVVGKQKHGDDDNPDLDHHRILAGSEEALDLEICNFAELLGIHAEFSCHLDVTMGKMVSLENGIDDGSFPGSWPDGNHQNLLFGSAPHGLHSTLVASQLPVDAWHKVIGDPTLADAILDRLIHTAYKINLKGESMRKQESSLTEIPDSE